MKKILLFLITFLSIFAFFSQSAQAATFYRCYGLTCTNVGYFGSQMDCEWYYSVPCYTTPNCDSKCGNEGSIGGGTTTQVPYYYCQDYTMNGIASKRCASAGTFTSTSACQSGIGKTCYTSTNCNGQCTEISKTTYYYCSEFTGACDSAGMYSSDYECSTAHGGRACYIATNCNSQCSSGSGSGSATQTPYYSCMTPTSCELIGYFTSLSACQQSYPGKTCYIDPNCNQQCGSGSGTTQPNQNYYVCLTNSCGSVGYFTSLSACQQSYPGKTCYIDPNCNQQCSSTGGGSGTSSCNNDGYCDSGSGETISNCIDCQTLTGCNYNNSCESSRGETSTNCPNDCPSAPVGNCQGVSLASRPATNILDTALNYSFTMNGLCGRGSYSTNIFCKFNLYMGPKSGGNKIGEYQVWPINDPYDTRVSKAVSGLSRYQYCYTISAYDNNTHALICESSEVCVGSITPPNPPTNSGYSCNTSTGLCSLVTGGIYSDSTTCSANCIKNTAGYNCNVSSGSCYQVASNAQYSTLATCSPNCKALTSGYNCNALTGTCSQVSLNAQYSTLATCSANCAQNTAGYNCNALTGTCSQVSSNAQYSTLATCSASCKINEALAVVTLDPTNIKQTTATFNGQITNRGGYSSLQGWFRYYKKSDGVWMATGIMGLSNASNDFLFNQTGLLPNTEYCYYAVIQATGTGVRAEGQLICFKTLAPIGYNCVNGSCRLGVSGEIYDYPDAGSCVLNCKTGAGYNCIDGSCSPVSSNAEYSTQNACSQFCKALTITVRTDQPTEITQSSARLNGALTDNGGRTDLEYFFRYQKQGDSSWTTTSAKPIGAIGSIFVDISGLEANTQYCYYAVARIIGQTIEYKGSTICFATDPLANLGIPILIHPIQDEIETNPLINFDWTDVAGAQFYEVWERFGNDTSTESTFYATQSQIQAQITEIGRHYWKARACIGVSNIRQNPNGPGVIFDGTPNCGGWSITETFIIANNNGITCVYGSGANQAVLPIDISACSMNVSFYDAIANSVINPNARLRIGDEIIMEIDTPSSDWTVSDSSTVRHPIVWKANAQTDYSSRLAITPNYPYPIDFNGNPSFVMVGVEATNPLIQDPDMVTTTISNNLSITRLEYGRYRIKVLSEGTGNINLNIGDLFSYATANGEVCGHGVVPGCSRSYSFTLQGTIPEEDVPGNGTTTTSTFPDGGGGDGGGGGISTSTCIDVSVNNGQKVITRRYDGSCAGEINAIIYDVARDQVLGRDAVLRIENYHDDGGGNNKAPSVTNLRNNSPDWCSSQSIRLEWDYSDPDNNPQSQYKIIIYDDKNNEVESKTVQGISTAYTFSLVNRYGKDYYWEVEVWDANKNSLSAKSSDRAKIIGIPKHQYPTPSFGHDEVQIGSNDIEYKVWFNDKSTAYDSEIKKYEWDFNGDGAWDKVFDTPEKIQTMKDHPETQMLYTYDPKSYTETILKVTDSDGYYCEYSENVIPEDFKYEDYSPINLNQ